MIRITRGQLDPIPITDTVRQDSNGAVVTFLGTTRRSSHGREVLFLDYEAYEPMAMQELQRIATEVTSMWNINDIAIVHRIGRIEIGDISLVVATASPHRKEAFEACHYVVDRIKETVPIWKKEVFKDGEVWVGCQSDHNISSPLDAREPVIQPKHTPFPSTQGD